MIVGQSIFSRHGVMRLLKQDQFPKTTSSIFQPIIPNTSGNVTLVSIVLITDCVAVGSALVSHFSYYWQNQVGNYTDIRDRYRALAADRLGGDFIMYDF